MQFARDTAPLGFLRRDQQTRVFLARPSFARQGVGAFNLGLAFGGDIRDKAFERQQFLVRGENPPTPFPNPFLRATGGANAIGQLERLARSQCRLHRFKNGTLIVGKNDLTVTGFEIAQKFLRRVTGEFAAAFTDKLHRPIRIV